MNQSTTTSIYPPSGRDATPVTSPAAAVRPILPPVRRVVGIGLPVQGRGHNVVRLFQVADRDQLLDALDRASAQPLVSEEDVLRAYNSRPEDTAFGRARLREKREAA